MTVTRNLTEVGRLEGDETGTPKQLQIDARAYDQILDNAHLNDAQRKQFLEAIWTIMATFIDLGYGITPTQLACHSGTVVQLCQKSHANHLKLAA